MKVFFLSPPPVDGVKSIREGRCMQSISSWAAVWPPISLGILASITRKKAKVRFVDGNVERVDIGDLIEGIKNYRSDVVVINTSFPTIESDMKIAMLIKEADRQIKTIGFGVYFTLLEEESLIGYPDLDFAISGEPEETFGELLDYLIEGKENFENIKGLIFSRDGKIIRNQKRPYIEDLDVLPHPARDLLRNERYRLPHNGHYFTLINTARGCPYPCIFCIAPHYYGKEIRRHSLGYIMEEIEECVLKYRIKHFLFWEEAFTWDRNFCSDLCDMIIESGLGISWAATTRADAVDEKILYKMKMANCNLLGLGIESSSQAILDVAKKGESLGDIEKAIRLCNKIGLKTIGHFIFGLPGETKETGERTIEYAVKLGLDYFQCYCAVPYPKTELWVMARRNGWITSYRWSDYDFGGRSILRTNNITPVEVDRLRSRAFRKFYFRFYFILRQVFVISSLKQLIGSLNFLNWMRLKGRKG